MGEITRYPPGAFCFIEAGSGDIGATNAFYRGLFGWEIDERSTPDGGVYTRFLKTGRPVAGAYLLGSDPAIDVPAHWLSYVSVADVVVTLELAVRLGATPMGDVVEVPGMVTVAEFIDPSGAVCGVWQPFAHIGAVYADEPGTLIWAELVTTDAAASAGFYGRVFGWTMETHMGPTGPYSFFKDGTALRGGMVTIGSDTGAVSPSWRAHIAVRDLEAAMTRVADLGGSAEIDATAIPGAGPRAVVRDPVGVSFILIEQADPLRS